MSHLSQKYIQNKFAEYYKLNATSILPPSSLERREFGFLLFEKKVMLRHKSFMDVARLRSSLIKINPSDVYYSSAYYEQPKEDMKEKVWLGADLVFDIDADHIPTPCSGLHDLWICTNCGFSGKGKHPLKCSSCEGMKFKENPWPCEICLEASKVEAIKLINILTEDFGFSSEILTVAFSGHRGYHVHVENESVQDLDSFARKEIVDYVMGIGLDANFHGLGKSPTPDRMVSGPDLNDQGWRGRLARGTYDFLQSVSKEELIKVGLKTSHINKLMDNKEALLESWNEKGPWGVIKGISPETWRKIAESGIERQSVKIDTVVTPDINRLIRLPNSLHGKTGLKKVEFPINKIDDFDPLISAVAFKEGNVTVDISEVPEFRVGNQIFGPFTHQKVELPTAAALMLLCKGLAKVVD